jgi:hypothetical protein
MSRRRTSVTPFPMLRPSMLMRRKALSSGVFGSSRVWKLVAIVMFGSSTFRRVFGKNPQVVEIATLKGPGHLMQIETLRHQTRRQRRRAAG